MPKTRMNGGTAVTVEEVFELAEMHHLAEDWASHGSDFPVSLLERYRALCASYAVDAASLLYSVQTKLREEHQVDTTATFPVLGDLAGVQHVG